MGWHLRFAKTDRVEALVSLKTVEQVRHQMHICTDWSFEFQEFDDHALAIMTRMKPRYADENKDKDTP